MISILIIVYLLGFLITWLYAVKIACAKAESIEDFEERALDILLVALIWFAFVPQTIFARLWNRFVRYLWARRPQPLDK